MQVWVDLVDWAWLAGLSDPSARVTALREPPPGRVVPGTELGCWNSDSAVELMEVGESLAAIANEVGGARAGLIRAAFPLVASYDLVAADELGLRSARDGYYYGSVSPAGVAAARAAAGRLDLGWLSAEIEPPSPSNTLRYLRQWLEAFGVAEARGLGIVADCR